MQGASRRAHLYYRGSSNSRVGFATLSPPSSSAPSWERENIVTALLTLVTVSVTYRLNLARRSDASGWQARARGECGARRRLCNPLPGGIGHQPAGTMRSGRPDDKVRETRELDLRSGLKRRAKAGTTTCFFFAPKLRASRDRFAIARAPRRAARTEILTLPWRGRVAHRRCAGWGERLLGELQRCDRFHPLPLAEPVIGRRFAPTR
jgi:hypothetical protein